MPWRHREEWGSSQHVHGKKCSQHQKSMRWHVLLWVASVLPSLTLSILQIYSTIKKTKSLGRNLTALKMPSHRQNVQKRHEYHKDVSHSIDCYWALNAFIERLSAAKHFKKYIANYLQATPELGSSHPANDLRDSIISWAGPSVASHLVQAIVTTHT